MTAFMEGLLDGKWELKKMVLTQLLFKLLMKMCEIFFRVSCNVFNSIAKNNLHFLFLMLIILTSLHIEKNFLQIFFLFLTI